MHTTEVSYFCSSYQHGVEINGPDFIWGAASFKLD